MTAALTPRVRALLVADRAQPSKTEKDVYHLRGVRSHLVVDAFPVHHPLSLFLILSSSHPGRFPASVQVVHNRTDRVIFHGEIDPPPTFQEEDEFLFVTVRVDVRFREAGRYLVQVWFFQQAAADILKMEQPFFVLQGEE